ncbi:NUDIX hydrolase [Streptomyces sp. NPDC057702]|uniref:NUDIX hydrolase n=1 Tax=unclassified Streptomyces TaxID=2593676 RepID=UPI00369445FB
MAEYAYALVYAKDGKFLIAKKRRKSFFYKGAIYPEGKKIERGAEKEALPGGRVETAQKETPPAAAAREFQEETGVADIGQHYAKHRTWKAGADTYHGVYFLVETGDKPKGLDAYFGLAGGNVIAGRSAASDIESKKITTYGEIHKKYPRAPVDNELYEIQRWDVNNKTTWAEIEKWKKDADPARSWFTDILGEIRQP